MQGLSSNRVGTRTYAAVAAAFFLLFPPAGFADSAACTASDSSLGCRLTGVLHWLEATALVLVLVLIVVIGVAIRLVRKNRLSRKGGR